LISRETSFVAVERRDTPVIGDVKLRRVPIALTDGWGGLTDVTARGMRMGARAGGPVMLGGMPAASAGIRGAFRAKPHLRVSDGGTEPFEADALFARVGPARPSRRSVAPDGMQGLIMYQTADGSWELTRGLAAIVGHDLADLVSAVDGASGPWRQVTRAWATALALAWLAQHASAVEDEWRMLGAKARKWLDDTSAVPAGGLTWVDAARTFLNP
jgi:hypothetical protein